MPLRAVLFDAGHTLVVPRDESLVEAARAAALDARAAELQESFRQAIRAINREPWPKAPPFRTLVSSELSAIGLSDEAEAAFWAVLDRHNAERRLWTQAVEGAREVLEALRASGVRVGVVSNSDGYCEHYLERAGLRAALEIVIDSGRVGVEKPDPRIFHHALGPLGVEPHETLFVGDRYDVDVLGARGVGMEAVLFDPGPASELGDEPVIQSLWKVLERIG